MSDKAVAAIGQILVELLREKLVPVIAGLAPNQIALLSPADAEGRDVRLTLFLYSLVEAPELKNEPHLTVDPTTQRAAPLSLDLYYLLSAHPAPSDGGTTLEQLHNNTVEAHETLGKAMQVFYDNGVLTGSALQGRLPADLELRLTLNPITVEDLTRIWSVFPDSGYNPSVSYLVTPVRIDSERTRATTRVRERRTEADQLAPA